MTRLIGDLIAPARRSDTKRSDRRSALPARYIFILAGIFCGTSAHAADRLDLDGTTITGNQELPKALHIVPWKAADPGDLAGRPLNSLVDEILAPVDRDVFLRELEYYEAVHSSE